MATKAKTRRSPAVGAKPKAFFDKERYSEMVQGLKDQGIERAEAVDTLKVGLREANGLPVPLELRASAA